MEATDSSVDMALEAYESIKPYLNELEQLVVDSIEELGPSTSDEVEAYVDMQHQTISPRITFLHQMGTLEDSGQRRFTRSGRRAIVWQLAAKPVTEALRKKRPLTVQSDSHVPAFA